jgi:ribosomal protein S18 acetylase RimI-like enzyme
MNENAHTNNNAPSCSVRTATFTDRATVEAIVRQCGKHVRDYFGIRNLIDFYRKGEVFIVEDPQPIAFAVAKPLIREQIISLYEIGVLPHKRGQGIATLLMRHIDALHPDREWRLVVNDDNEPARIAYERLGLRAYAYDKTKGGRPIIRMQGKLK